MPISVRCPNCQAKLNAPDAAAGRRVKCPKCETRVPVPAASGGSGPAPAIPAATPAAPPPLPPEAAPEPPPEPPFESGSPFDFSEAPTAPAALPEAPRPAEAPPPPAPAPAAAFNFDAAAEAGAGKPARGGPRKAPRPVEDEETDEPPRRGGRRPPKPPPEKKSGSPLVLILVVAGLLFLGCCIGGPIGVYYFLSSKVEEVRDAVEKERARVARDEKGTPPIGTAGQASIPTGWKQYAPSSGSFKAYFPGDVDEEPGEQISPTGRKLPATITKIYSSASDDDSLRVEVAVLPFDPRLSPKDREDAMSVMRKQLVGEGGPGGKGPREETQKSVRWLGTNATEKVYSVGGPGGSGKLVAREAIVGNHGFIAVLGGRDSRPKPEFEKGFFENFEATAK